MGFTNQSIVTIFETLSTPGKKGQKQSPIVDAGDVQKLMLTLPYLLNGLADEELEAHNSAARAVAARIVDPIPETCMAINEWLHWYKLFRKPEPTDDDVSRLTDMGEALLSTLVRVFPFKVRVGRVSFRSMWCNEKVHSILHAPRTLVRMGRSQNVSCQVTETSHKGVKRKGSRSNRNISEPCCTYSYVFEKMGDVLCHIRANIRTETYICTLYISCTYIRVCTYCQYLLVSACI